MEKMMRCLRSKPLLFISASFLATLLITFTVQLLLHPSTDRSDEKVSKTEAPLPAQNPMSEPKDSMSFDWRDQPSVRPQRSLCAESPQETLTHSREKPQNEYLFWDEVQKDLAWIIREKFPELRLSQRDLQALTESIRTFQNSMLSLRALERTRSNREEIRKIRGEASRAMETFEEITQMSISDFILYGRPESGLDNGKADDDEIVEEYLDHSKS